MSFFAVLSSHIIATHRYINVSDDTNCAICRDNIYDPVVDNNISYNKISQGECMHCFHEHCINKWIRKANRCPLCNQQWKQNKLFK